MNIYKFTCWNHSADSAQDWESNAHAGVSIATAIAEVTQLIIKWRKMELSSWKPWTGQLPHRNLFWYNKMY